MRTRAYYCGVSVAEEAELLMECDQKDRCCIVPQSMYWKMKPCAAQQETELAKKLEAFYDELIKTGFSSKESFELTKIYLLKVGDKE